MRVRSISCACALSVIVGCGPSREDLFTGESGGTGGSAGGTGGSSGLGGVGGGSGGSSGSGGSGGDCNFTGAWGSFARIPVTWPGTAILEPGGGDIQVWILTRRTQQGTDATDQGQLCGIQLPPFQTTAIGGGERYGIRFLAETFDAGAMPPFTLQTNLHGLTAGATYAQLPGAIVFGLTLSDPLMEPWPTNIATADHDADGRPGVTTQTEKGAGFFNLPLDLGKVARAKELFVASRTKTQISGTIVSCDEIAGDVQVGTINNVPALDSAIVGCVREDNLQCDATQTAFLDANGPEFQPAPGSTLTSKRIADDSTCAHVRGMYIATP